MMTDLRNVLSPDASIPMSMTDRSATIGAALMIAASSNEKWNVANEVMTDLLCASYDADCLRVYLDPWGRPSAYVIDAEYHSQDRQSVGRVILTRAGSADRFLVDLCCSNVDRQVVLKTWLEDIQPKSIKFRSKSGGGGFCIATGSQALSDAGRSIRLRYGTDVLDGGGIQPCDVRYGHSEWLEMAQSFMALSNDGQHKRRCFVTTWRELSALRNAGQLIIRDDGSAIGAWELCDVSGTTQLDTEFQRATAYRVLGVGPCVLFRVLCGTEDGIGAIIAQVIAMYGNDRIYALTVGGTEYDGEARVRRIAPHTFSEPTRDTETWTRDGAA